MKNLRSIFKNKKILITGHTGFKGAWLTLYLHNLGGKILGISKDIPSNPSLFKILGLKKKIKHSKIDIRELKKLREIFLRFNPDFVFHLAAQALVRKSYKYPLNTWSSNLNGTINLLECIRLQKKKSTVIMITSDKAYKNMETTKGYKELDQLGGIDPYGASKSAADIAIKSYIESFFKTKLNNKYIAIARAGNVIGGGDWSDDRLFPDSIKKWLKGKKVIIRSPNSTRPWQNVLDVIRGYSILAAKLSQNKKLHGQAFNFGPRSKNYKVIEILNLSKKFWPSIQWKIKKKKKLFFENTLLNLNSAKARRYLNWKPKLSFYNNIKSTILWYREYGKKKRNLINFSIDQINKLDK